MSACLGTILTTEYPQSWPEFLPAVCNLLQQPPSPTEHTIQAGLAALWEVVSVYRFKQVDKRGPLNAIIEATFPLLLKLSGTLITNTDVESGELMHRILKIYYGSMQYELTGSLQSGESLVPWGTLFIQTVEKDLSSIPMPEDSSEREKHPWWKAKKWAYHCIYHLFSKYGLQNATDKASKYAQFSKYFLENFAPTILKTYLKQIHLLISGVWLSNRSKQQISILLQDSIKKKNLWVLLEPELENLVVRYIFPQLCLTEEDAEQWENDPVEYIQRKMDPMEDFRSSVAAAQNLLSGLVKHRFKQTFVPIISFVTNMLESYENTPQDQRNPKNKDGAIHMLSCLAKELFGKVGNLCWKFML